MRQISLREFRVRGARSLAAVPAGETILLSGQDGPAYFLVPVVEDVIAEDRELRRAMAKTSLRNNWRLAQASPDALSDDALEQEIAGSRLAARQPEGK